MEACLGEDLPPTTELEEGLRNGVYLAKLGNFFSPKVVSLKKIYDREQTRYKVSPLRGVSLEHICECELAHVRHLWRNPCKMCACSKRSIALKKPRVRE